MKSSPRRWHTCPQHMTYICCYPLLIGTCRMSMLRNLCRLMTPNTCQQHTGDTRSFQHDRRACLQHTTYSCRRPQLTDTCRMGIQSMRLQSRQNTCQLHTGGTRSSQHDRRACLLHTTYSCRRPQLTDTCRMGIQSMRLQSRHPQ